MNRDDDKRAAAVAAADEVRDGMLIGLGSGSTAAFLIAEIGRRCAAGLRIEAVAASLRSEAAARAARIPLRDMGGVAALDLTIDGVDEIDPALRAIKGGGGAMLREKVIAQAARRMVAIADGSKQVARLGRGPVPIEVLPFAVASVAARVAALGGQAQARGTPSDQGNAILDCAFGLLNDPAALAANLAQIPGMLGHGLFLGEVDAFYVADAGIARCVARPDPD